MKKIIRLLLTLMVLVLMLPSCNKGPGEGGTGTLLGFVKLINHPYDDFSLTLDTIVADNSVVYISYGGDDGYGNHTQTNAEGLYLFENLSPGDYTILVNSPLDWEECVNIRLNNGSVTQAPTLYIHDGKVYGSSIIKGRVYAAYYQNGDYLGNSWAYEHRVYIRREGVDIPFDDTRVGPDGYFVFQNIPPGRYEVFTMTEVFNEVPHFVYQTITVYAAIQIYELEEQFEVIISSEQPSRFHEVKGRVYAFYYHNGSYRGEGWACEHLVYIRRAGEDIPFDDTRVGPDGYFAFQKLLPGEYEVYTVTQDFYEVPDFVFQTITVEEAEQTYELEERFEVIINV